MEYISRKLAKFYVNVKYRDIPECIVEKTKRHIIDSLGAGIAGSLSDEYHKIMQLMYILQREHGTAPVWGTGELVDPLNAALLNGVACHAFELDDTGGCDHSGAVIIPAAIACLSLCNRKVSGQEFITAIVLGYDMARRALEACGAYELHNEAGWHSTGTCGSFGSAVAAGYLLKLSVDEMQSAIGIAASTSSGLWAFIHDGAQTKRLHAGRSAEGGLLAALLARQGFRGPKLIFEKVWGGFTHTFAPLSEVPEAWQNDLGVNWKIARVSIKPYTSCRSIHSSIDAVKFIMKKYSLTATDIKKIRVELNTFVNDMCGSRDTVSMSAAQMSIPYGIAAILAYGSANLTSYTAEKRNGNQIQAMLDKIELTVNQTMAADEEPMVTVITNNDNMDQMTVEVPLGAPTNPISDQQLLAKYNDLGSMIWSQHIIQQLFDQIFSLEKQEDMDTVVDILRIEPNKLGIIS